MQSTVSDVGERRPPVVEHSATGVSDLVECTKSRRSCEIFESLQHDRQLSYQLAKHEQKKLIEVWREQGWWHVITPPLVGLCILCYYIRCKFFSV